MEKEIGSKEVKLDVIRNSEVNAQQSEKLSYEKLKETTNRLSQQNQQMGNYIQSLHTQIQQMAEVIRDKRIDYLFKVAEISIKSKTSEYACFTKDFVENCIAEIQQLLTPPVEEGLKENNKED